MKLSLKICFIFFITNQIINSNINENLPKEKHNKNNFVTVSFNKGMSNSPRFNLKKIKHNEKYKILKELFHKHVIDNPQYSDTPKTPKIIHQIWLGNNGKLPEKYKTFQKTWLENHPDWKYMLWTEKEIEEFGLINKAQYDEIDNYGYKSDLARYEIIYRIGGLYVDTDFECIKPFDYLHHICDFYTGAHFRATSIYNGLIAAAPGHPVLLECINSIKKQGQKKDTSPGFFTQCFFKAIKSHSGPSVALPVNYVYPWPCWDRHKKNPTKWIRNESIAIHHWFESWVK